jgi:endonuclease/exonuclease/phosphatase family metal-dependent hydrolase|uniref:Craniofacial development protein 2 n=1 Tax=Sipha flava TaxID=143950 RepID=A0A2S2QZA4_9HEMI
MGDFNAKIGEGKIPGVAEEFGLGVRNYRRERLIQFCIKKKLTVMNTCFKLPKRRLYTWKSPAVTQMHLVRNQIDYILINSRYKNAIQTVKTYPEADVPSDHNL